MTRPYLLTACDSDTVWTIQPHHNHGVPPYADDIVYLNDLPIARIDNVITSEYNTFEVTFTEAAPYTLLGTVLNIGKV